MTIFLCLITKEYLVYINDIVNDIESNINLFADDTSLSMAVGDPDTAGAILKTDINKITAWANRWLVKFNPLKSESLIISRKRNKPAHRIFLCLVLKFHQCRFISISVFSYLMTAPGIIM